MTTEKKKTKTSRGSSVRRKGHNFERFIANWFKVFDPQARRNVTETQEGSWDISTNLPVALQCKCFAKWHTSPHAIYEDSAKKSQDRMPIIITRIDNKRPDLAFCSLEDMEKLLKSYFEKVK